jgi:hypothetical protein
MFNDKKVDPIRQRASREMRSMIRQQVEMMREYNAEKKAEEERKKSER